MSDPIEQRLTSALRAAEIAGSIVLEHFAHIGLEVEIKGDGSPVTIADRDAETAIRDHLAEAFPDDSIEGEEHDLVEGTSGYNWIIDPIDGTYSFVKGVPLFGTLIGLEQDSQPIAGVIHMPALGETVFAGLGLGAWHRVRGREPVPARVSETSDLDAALLCTTSFDYFRDSATESIHERLLRSFPHTRGWSDCYAAVLLATGRADAIVEPMVHPWDIAAIFAIVREAGGRCTDWTGSPSIRAGTCVMSNGRIQDSVLALVSGENA